MPFKKNAGFSLIELLVVMVIIGLIVGIGLPAFSGSVQKASIRSGASQLASALRAVRAKSVSEKAIFSLVIDNEKKIIYPLKGMYSPEDRDAKKALAIDIPPDIAIWKKNGQRVRVTSVRFSPMGTSSGATLYVTSTDASFYDDGVGYLIEVDLISGRTKMFPTAKEKQ